MSGLLPLALIVASVTLGARSVVAVAFTDPPAVVSQGILVLGFAVIAARSPGAALVSFVALAPGLAGFGRMAIFGHPLPVVAALTGVLAGLLFARRTWKLIPLRPRELPLVLTSLCALAGLAVLFTRHPALLSVELLRTPLWGFSDARYGLISGTLLVMAGTITVIIGRIPSRILVDQAPVVFGAWLIAAAGFALVQVAWGEPNLFAGLALSSPGRDIHEFGTFTVTIFAYFAHRAAVVESPGRAWRWVLAGLALALVVGSFSRMTWLVAGGVVAFLMWRTLPTKWILAAAGGFAAILVGLHFLPEPEAGSTPAYAHRALSALRFASLWRGEEFRVELWSRAWAMLTDRPLTGYGLGTYFMESLAFADSSSAYGSTREFAHNTFLQFGAETGIAGLLALMAVAALAGLALYLHRREGGVIGAGALAAVAFLTTQLSSNSLLIYELQIPLFAWLLGLLVARPQPL